MTEQKEIKVEDIKNAAEVKGCPVQKALYYVTEFLAGPMCGRCFPCALGSYEARVRLQNIVEGRGAEADLLAVKRIATDMSEASMCKKGKDTAKFILEWMSTGVFHEHARGRCPERACLSLIEYSIIPDKCTMCGLCQDVCKYTAIIGEKKKPYRSGYLPFEIRQKRCAKCGECIKVCPEGAIIITDLKVKEPVGV
ncbi:MAG: 4Fe-4S binding protein [Nitrospirae bacterium]|nr:4Fe-4S binding protein [Nitrospirota bacterium]